MLRIFLTVACLLISADALRLESLVDRRTIVRAIAAVPSVVIAQTASAEGGRISAAMDGKSTAPWMAPAASNVVLGYTSEATKPTFKEFAADLDDKAMKEASSGGQGRTLGFQSGKRVDESGAAYKKESLTGSPSQAASLAGRKGGNLPTIRIAGTWADPGHPGCNRKIQLAGNKAFINGADEDGKPWKAVGIIDGNDVTIDFSSKGGPKDVKATFVIGKGLVFPDGNTWSKAS